MYVDHEVMEVDAVLLLEGQAVVEQVHQPGFATANTAPEVDATVAIFRLKAEFFKQALIPGYA